LSVLVYRVGIGQASAELAESIEQSGKEFEEAASRLTIRVGPEAKLARVCSELLGLVHQAQDDLVMVRGLENALASDRLDDDDREEAERKHMDLLRRLIDYSPRLREFRPRYIAAANEQAVVMASPVTAAG
jgi:hypothetical protein